MTLKRIYKITGIILMSLLLLLGGAYYLVISHANSFLEDYISGQTNGKLKLKCDKTQIDFRDSRLLLVRPRFYADDSLHQASTYDIRLDTLKLEIQSWTPLLLKRKVVIDTIMFIRPDIHITKWRASGKEAFSLSSQMGKMYQTLNRSLDQLSVKFCLIDSGRLRLTDKVNPERGEVAITDFYFRMDNLNRQTQGSHHKRRFLESDQVKLYSSRQHIQINGGDQQISYSRMRINSRRRTLELDSCRLFSRKRGESSSEFTAFFDTLRFVGVDFIRLTEEELLDADSVYCIRPRVEFQTQLLHNKPRFRMSDNRISGDSLSSMVKSLLGDVDLAYIGMYDGSLSLVSRTPRGTTSYSIRKTDFSMSDLTIIDRPDVPIGIGTFELGLKGYEAYSRDSSLQVRFDSVRFANAQVSLAHFTIRPMKVTSGAGFSEMGMEALNIRNISWIDLLAAKRIVAEEVELYRPFITLQEGRGRAAAGDSGKGIIPLVQKMSEWADVKKLAVRDGSLRYQSDGMDVIGLNQLNTSIPVNDFLHSSSVSELAMVPADISFGDGFFDPGGKVIRLEEGRISGKKKNVFIRKARYQLPEQQMTLEFDSLQLTEFFESAENQFQISGLEWNRALLKRTGKSEKVSNTRTRRKPIRLDIASIIGRNTIIRMQDSNSRVHIQSDLLEATDFRFAGTINGLSFSRWGMSGPAMEIVSPGFSIQTERYDVRHQDQSVLEQVRLTMQGTRRKTLGVMPQVRGAVDLLTVLKGKPRLGLLEFRQPQLQIYPADTAWVRQSSLRKKKSSWPEFSIDSMGLYSPRLGDGAETLIPGVVWGQTALALTAGGLHSADSQITVQQLNLDMGGFQYEKDAVSLFLPHDSAVQLSLQSIWLRPRPDSALQWSAQVRAFQLRDMAASLRTADSSLRHMHVARVSLSDIPVHSGWLKNPRNEFLSLKQGQCRELSMAYHTGTQILSLKGAHHDFAQRTLTLQSFSMHPAVSRDSFLRSQKWQNDYMTLDLGGVKLQQVDTRGFLLDSVLRMRSLQADTFRLSIYKDKRLLFRHGVEKPLPVEMLQRIPVRFNLDSVRLNQAQVEYEEFSDQTQKSGRVYFPSLRADVYHLSNNGHRAGDSLRLQASGRLLDQAFIRVRFHQSYTDSLQGFQLAVRLRPFSMNLLNPVTEPLASARIRSGQLDTLRLNAIGYKQMAHGKMKMYYSGLKIRYLNKGNDSLNTFKTRLITFLANDILLRRNNRKGTGMAYFERNPERSFVNYWLKITMSGVISSTGIRSNRAVEKKYLRGLQKLHVPEMPEVEL